MREFVPFAVLAGTHQLLRLCFQPLEDTDFCVEFLNRLGGRGLIDDLFLKLLLFLGIEVVRVLGDRLA